MPYAETSIDTVEKNLSNTNNFAQTSGFKGKDTMSLYKTANDQKKPHDIATSLPMGGKLGCDI